MRLALGTAQFGLDYGVSNTQGQVHPDEVKEILTFAKHQGISLLDTAPAYGGSEQVLGQSCITSQFEIISKIPALENANANIEQYVKTSLEKLKQKKLAGILFHHVEDVMSLSEGRKRFKALTDMKLSGKIDKVGISVYTPKQLDFCLKNHPVDIVQLPLNCLDQRFISTGQLDELAERNIEVHCRSIFLQGLLLMDFKHLPAYFEPFKHYFKHFLDTAEQLKVSTLSLALALGCQQSSISSIVVGCCSVNQLSEIITAYKLAANIDEDLSSLACEDVKLLIPSNWP